MKTKKIFIATMLVCLISLIACNVSFASIFGNNKQDNSYRIVQIYKMDGDVTIQREGTGKITPYNGMSLVSGDEVKIASNGNLYLRVDNDKYIMAEPSTTFVVEVSGTAQNSKTKITVRQGAITNRVDGKLNQNSSYEVYTPNSTMAIRGTLVRTKVMSNPNQTQSTYTDVFEGIVEMHAVKPDGTIDPTPTMLNQNESQQIVADKDGNVSFKEKGTVNYGSLPLDTLGFLEQSAKDGRELSISKEEISNVKDKKEAAIIAKNTTVSNNTGSSSINNITITETQAETQKETQAETQKETEPETKAADEADIKKQIEDLIKEDASKQAEYESISAAYESQKKMESQSSGEPTGQKESDVTAKESSSGSTSESKGGGKSGGNWSDWWEWFWKYWGK